MGEEFGEQPGHLGQPGQVGKPIFRWIIDPIDGTKSFIRGVPLYGVMIALEVDSVAALGVLHFPALDETVAAARGLGCRFNGVRCQVSQTDKLADALLLSSAVPGRHTLAEPRDGRDDLAANARLDKLVRSVKLFRTWGDCYGYAMVATGRAEIMLDPRLAIWDCAPMLPIMLEAGGKFTDLRGEPTIYGASGVATNGRLHDEVLAIINATV